MTPDMHAAYDPEREIQHAASYIAEASDLLHIAAEHAQDAGQPDLAGKLRALSAAMLALSDSI